MTGHALNEEVCWDVGGHGRTRCRGDSPGAGGSIPQRMPPSFTSWDVSTQPYQVDNQVDAEGNGDGFVCAKPLDSKTFQVAGQTYQIYNFIDNVAGTR